MKLHGNLFEKIIDEENLKLAHRHARKGKGWYDEVRKVDSNIRKSSDGFGTMLKKLQKSLIEHTYQTSPYTMKQKKEGKKIRDLYKLPYYPDRIGQWAVIQIIEPYLINHLISDTYSAIPGRGIHYGLKRVQKAMWEDVWNCQYCLKLDARHFYQSINHEILKDKFRRIFKDMDVIWFIEEVIDSIETATPEDRERLKHLKEPSSKILNRYVRGRNETPEQRKTRYLNSGVGLPIGNYFSQYGGNFYFSEFDHFMKEDLHHDHYYRYMDDLVIFAETKEKLHKLLFQIDHYFQTNMRITLKDNYQIFPTYKRGVDYLGYRIFLEYTLLRKSTCEMYKRKMIWIRQKVESGIGITFTDYCCFNSYNGWLKWCDHFRLYKKYGEPLEQPMFDYYRISIRNKERMIINDSSRNYQINYCTG